MTKEERFEVKGCMTPNGQAWAVVDHWMEGCMWIFTKKEAAEERRTRLLDTREEQQVSGRLWRRAWMQLRNVYEQARWAMHPELGKHVTGAEHRGIHERFVDMYCQFGGITELQIKALLRNKGKSKKGTRKLSHNLGKGLAALEEGGYEIEEEYGRWTEGIGRQARRLAEEVDGGHPWENLEWKTAESVVASMATWRDLWYWGEDKRGTDFGGKEKLPRLIVLCYVLDHLLLREHREAVHSPGGWVGIETYSIWDVKDPKRMGEAVWGLVNPWGERSRIQNPMWEYTTAYDWWRGPPRKGMR